MELGEYIYRDIEKNTYLINLYTNLLKRYTAYLFKFDDKESDFEPININHLLRFADLLSKSTNNSKKQIHNNIAQNIVVLLNKLYPDNETINSIMISVLTNINNYRGIKEEKYYNNDIREFIAQYIEKQLYKIDNEKEEMYFVRDQKEIYNAMKSEKFYSYSGPTSMGKTFVIKTFIINRIRDDERENFVIVVPTKALISEIASDFINELNDLLEEKKYKVITTSNSIEENNDYNYIMIYTQERFLQHLLNCKIKINYVFIDEAHKIFDNDSRNIYFYKILDILNGQADMPCIFFSAPLIENPNEFLKLLPNTVKTSSRVFKFSPVNQQKYIIDYNDENIRVYNDLTKNFIELEYHKINQYDINNILQILGGNYSNIVYCENKEETVEMALQYADSRDEIENNEELEKIKKRIKEEIHPDYYLAELISKGVAYHVSYVPSDIRKYIEILYKKKTISTIFCTSTLLEGVNLPADNLFVTIKNRASLLKNELDFKNLIGRVGRIKYYNLIGNVFIIPKSESNEIINRCSNIIENDVPEQELLIKKVLSDKKKKEIVELLKNGETFIKKTTSMTYPQYESIRYIMNTLINDIVNEKMGNISQEFSNFINDEDKKIIKEVFEEKKSKISNNMPITIDQIEAIDEAILKEELVYPSTIEYKEVLVFLETLYWKFEWNIYESKKGLGNLNNLKYYAVVLQRWMLGLGLSQIVKYAIEHHEPIISERMFNQVQEILQKRGGVRGSGRRKGNFSRKYPFSSRLHCGFCGSLLTRRNWHSGTKNSITVWHCMEFVKHGKENCPHCKAIKESIIEEAFTQSYKLLCDSNKELIQTFLNEMEEIIQEESNESSIKRREEQKQILKEKIDKLIDLNLNGTISTETLQEKKAKLQNRINKITKEQEHLQLEIEDSMSLNQGLNKFKTLFKDNEIMPNFDKDVFELMIEKVIIGEKDSKGKVNPRVITFILKSGNEIKCEENNDSVVKENLTTEESQNQQPSYEAGENYLQKVSEPR